LTEDLDGIEEVNVFGAELLVKLVVLYMIGWVEGA
jgi:hypothetical protein